MPDEHVGCLVCGAEGEFKFSQRDYSCGLPGDFGQRWCEKCEIFFQSPRPNEKSSSDYYLKSYTPYQKASEGIAEKVGRWLGISQYRQNLVRRLVGDGRILDVGCGNGEFLNLLEGRWEKFAMDLEEHARFDSPVRFFEGRIDRNRPDLQSLDVITLWHAFEHLYDPKKALQYIAEMLRPGGYLLIAVPEPACLERRVFGRYWIGWDPPRHVATYSERSINAFFRQAGLHMVAAPPDICNGAMLAMNFEHVLRGAGVQAHLHESTLIRMLLAPLAVLAVSVGMPAARVYVGQK